MKTAKRLSKHSGEAKCRTTFGRRYPGKCQGQKQAQFYKLRSATVNFDRQNISVFAKVVAPSAEVVTLVRLTNVDQCQLCRVLSECPRLSSSAPFNCRYRSAQPRAPILLQRAANAECVLRACSERRIS